MGCANKNPKKKSFQSILRAHGDYDGYNYDGMILAYY
jgi:hypothetical protein